MSIGGAFCALCGEGTFSVNGRQCVGCDAGKYANSTGMTACTACGPGQVALPWASDCSFCDRGTYSSSQNSTNCTSCPQGTWSLRSLSGPSGCATNKDASSLKTCLFKTNPSSQVITYPGADRADNDDAKVYDYSQAKQCVNLRRDIEPWPALVVQPSDVSGVQRAITCAAANGFQVCAKGGGWGVENAAGCSGGLQVDLRNLKGVTVDAKNNWVRFSAGDLLSEVWNTVNQTSNLLVVPFDPSPAGAVGLTLGCGHGTLTRLFGTACQNLYKLEYVDATGTVRTIGSADFVEPVQGWTDMGCWKNQGNSPDDLAQNVTSKEDCSALAHSNNKAIFGIVSQSTGLRCQLVTDMSRLTSASPNNCANDKVGAFMKVYQMVGVPVILPAALSAAISFKGCYVDQVPSANRGNVVGYAIADCKDLAAQLLLPYFAMADQAACIGLATLPSTTQPACPATVSGGYQMGGPGVLATYALKRTDKVVYRGCYPHDVPRSAGMKAKGYTLKDCAFLAKNDLANYFGMEWPGAFADLGVAHCNVLMVLPAVSTKVDDSFCDGETLFGRLLGDYRFMAVYELVGQVVDAASDQDLLWMAKGGGGEFPGIVTRVYMKAFKVPSSNWLNYTWSCTANNPVDAAIVMQKWLMYNSMVSPTSKKFSSILLNVKPVFQLQVTFFCLTCNDAQAAAAQAEIASICAVKRRTAGFSPVASKANRTVSRIGFSWSVSDQFVRDLLLTLLQAPDAALQVSVTWAPIRGPVTSTSATYDTAEWVLYVQHTWDYTAGDLIDEPAATHYLQVSSILDSYLACAGHYNYPDKFITCAGTKDERLEALFSDVPKMRQIKDAADPSNVFRSILRQAPVTPPPVNTRAKKGSKSKKHAKGRSKSKKSKGNSQKHAEIATSLKASLNALIGLQGHGISLAGALATVVAIVTLSILAAISCRWAIGSSTQKYDRAPVPEGHHDGEARARELMME